MTDSLEIVAPAFVTMAHRIVWAIVGTVDTAGLPSTRVLHPIWEWDGSTLTGWIATSPLSPKAKHLASTPKVSITYWAPNHDTCTAACSTVWELSPEQREIGWKRFAEAPAPLGYDPKIIPVWTDPQVPDFGILRLEPTALRVMDGTAMTAGVGQMLNWKDG